MGTILFNKSALRVSYLRVGCLHTKRRKLIHPHVLPNRTAIVITVIYKNNKALDKQPSPISTNTLRKPVIRSQYNLQARRRIYR